MALHSYHCLSKGKGLSFISNNKLSHSNTKRRCSFWLEKIWVRYRTGLSFLCWDSSLLSPGLPHCFALRRAVPCTLGSTSGAQPSSLNRVTGGDKASTFSRCGRPLPRISTSASRALPPTPGGLRPGTIFSSHSDTEYSGLSSNYVRDMVRQTWVPSIGSQSLSSWWPRPSSSMLRLSLEVNTESCFSFQ